MKNIIFTGILLVTLSGILSATVYTTLPTGFLSWNDPAAWMDGVVPPSLIGENDAVIIRSTILMGPTSSGPTVVVNNGTIIIEENGYWGFWNNFTSGISLTNNGYIRIDGELQTSKANYTGVDNLYFNYGVIEINGEYRSTAVFENFGSILVQTSGIFANYNWSMGSGFVYCFEGWFRNFGEVVNQGGSIDTDQCGGGLAYLTNQPITSGSCAAPKTVTAFRDASGDLYINWPYTQSAVEYGVQITDNTTGARFKTLVPSTDQNFKVPAAQVPSGTNLSFGVVALCSPGIISASNFLENSMPIATRIADHNVSLNIYPNPADNLVNVQYAENFKEIHIIDYLGRKVISTAGVSQIDVSMLSPGYYLISAEKDGNWITKKLIVK